MVKVGLAGIGFMGVTHYKAWAGVPGARLEALCESYEKRLTGDWTDIQGNFGDSGGMQDLSPYRLYSDFKAFVADPELDLIDICLPTRLHPEFAITALEAGKHVLCEKPIAIDPADADRMVAAAEANDRLLMVGQVLRFWPEWLWLKQTLDAGTYGKLLALNLRRVISMPDWSQDMRNLAANGGPMIDLHIHDVDFILYLLGKPNRVTSVGQTAEGLVTYISTLYHYDETTVSCQSGAGSMKGRMFCHEYEALFEQGSAFFKFATEPAEIDAAAGQSACQVLTVYLPDGSAVFPTPPATEAFRAELTHAAECVAGGLRSPIIDCRSARDSLALTCAEARSVLEGGSVEV